MNGKIIKLFAMVMVLALVVSMSATGIMYNTDSASAAGILKWLKIPVPDEADYQLLPGSDVKCIITTPSGDRLFAAVHNLGGDFSGAGGDNEWHVMTSTDGGFEWVDTGYNEWVADPAEEIVDMVLSPNWEQGPNFRYLYVATSTKVHKTSDGGDTFTTMLDDYITNSDAITSIDVAFTERGYEVLLGTWGNTEPDVWLWNDAWIDQGADVGAVGGFEGVLDVAFSPTYRDDDIIYCVVNAQLGSAVTAAMQTVVRMATDPARYGTDIANWGGYVSDAPFFDDEDDPILCQDPTGGDGYWGRARMDFADDYDSTPGSPGWSVFVALTAYEDIGEVGSLEGWGDVYQVVITTTFVTASDVEDLDVRGEGTETNVWSLAVSGDSDMATILAAIREADVIASTALLAGGVHYSTNGGDSWLQSYKPPSGMVDTVSAYFGGMVDGEEKTVFETDLAMAPDFESSGMAYAATWGDFSGVWVSTTDGTTWDGRGLLDYEMFDITDIEPSPRYATDDTIFMVTAMNNSQTGEYNDDPGISYALGILWQTRDAGNTWEVILAMNALFPLPGINMNNVELARDYPDDNWVFVTGAMVARRDAAGPWDCTKLLGSADGGNTFTIPVGTDEFVITDFVALGGSEIIAAGWDLNDADGEMGIWKTEQTAYSWDRAAIMGLTDADEATVTDMEVYDTSILVGTGPAPDRGFGSGGVAVFPTHAFTGDEGGQVFICYDYFDDFLFERVGDDPGTIGDEAFIAFDTDYYQNDIVYAGVNSSFSGAMGEVWRYDLGGTLPWEQVSSAKDAPCPDDWELLDGTGTPVEFDVWSGADDPGPDGMTPMQVVGLTCADDGTLYSMDQILPVAFKGTAMPPIADNITGNGLTWRCANPLEEYIDLGDEPLFEPMGVGLGWPDNGRDLPIVHKDMEVVGGGSNYLLAIGRDTANQPAIYQYYDTLTQKRETGPIDLIRPADGSTGVGTTVGQNKVAVVLEWEEAPGAQIYEWEVGLDAQFNTKVAHAQFLDTQPVANLHHTDAESLQGYLWPEDAFYWHVRVVEPYLSEWSETWSFDTTPESAGPKPSLVSPAAGSTGASRKPMLQWDIAVNADCYKVVVAKDCDWSNPTFQKETGEETVAQVTTTLAYGTSYCWKVTAYNGGCDGTELGTSYGSFTTEAEPVVPEEEGTPFWVWLVIAIAAILLIAVIALIVLTKRT